MNYLNIDFYTLLNNFKEILSQSKKFEDYDYHGSNISVLIELLSYMTELNTFYVNKLAQNTYLDTADIYENVHRLANYVGYEPWSFLASIVDIKVTVKRVNKGEQLQIPQWFTFLVNNSVPYTITKQFNIEVKHKEKDDDTFEFREGLEDGDGNIYNEFIFYIQAVQGRKVELEFSGSDIVDNMILLPDEFSYASNPDYDVISLQVNNYEWIRVEDLFDRIDTNNVYLFKYDKYKRPMIEFGLSRNVPQSYEKVDIILLHTLAGDGTIGPNDINEIKGNFIKNNSKDGEWINQENIKVSNPKSSYKGNKPETISEIKYGAKEQLKAQYRNVTRFDYIGYLKAKSDIDAASVWGEKEICPSGHTMDYNRVYLSIIPNMWEETTVKYANIDWNIDINDIPMTTTMIVPSGYHDEYKQIILDYIEPREVISTEKVFILPRLIYFAFDFGIKIRRPYNLLNVLETFKRKLKYFFNPKLREFNNVIDFKEIHNFMLDLTVRNGEDDFNEMRAVENIVFRDVKISYPPGGTYYPTGSLSKTTEFEYPVYWKYDNNKLPYNNSDFFAVLIDDNIYLYGGNNNSDMILSGNMNNLNEWNIETDVLPIPLQASSVFDYYQYVYIYGGLSNNISSNKIFKIDKNEPTILIESDYELPFSLNNMGMIEIGEYVYFYGGSTNNDYTGSNDYILRAHMNNFEDVHNTNSFLPLKVSGHQLYLFENYIYLIGGITETGEYNNKIYRANVNNPIMFEDTEQVIPYNVSNFKIKKIGKYLYIYGGYNEEGKLNSIYRTFFDDPYGWYKLEYDVNFNVSHYELIEFNDNIYLFGGVDDKIIYAPILGNILYTPSITGSHVYEPNYDHDYPYYTIEKFEETFDNKLRPIRLGFNDFPMLALEVCKFTEES